MQKSNPINFNSDLFYYTGLYAGKFRNEWYIITIGEINNYEEYKKIIKYKERYYLDLSRDDSEVEIYEDIEKYNIRELDLWIKVKEISSRY